jgi:hypothetical protein
MSERDLWNAEGLDGGGELLRQNWRRSAARARQDAGVVRLGSERTFDPAGSDLDSLVELLPEAADSISMAFRAWFKTSGFLCGGPVPSGGV